MIITEISATDQPARISLGRCTPTAIRAVDITTLAISNTRPRVIAFFLPRIAHRTNNANAILIETAAWSDGKEAVGKCFITRRPADVSAVSGLTLSTRCCIQIFIRVATAPVTRTNHAPTFAEKCFFTIPYRI